MSSGNKALVAYIGTPHAGYLSLFRKHADAVLYVLGDEFIREFPPLTRNLPGVHPNDAFRMVNALGIFREVRMLTTNALPTVRNMQIVMPDEDLSAFLAVKYFSGCDVALDGGWKLRWDWGAVQKARVPQGQGEVTLDAFHREVMRLTIAESKRSPDWWRQVGAALAKDGKLLLLAYNRHVPYEQSNYYFGDPRSNFGPGQCIEVSGAAHAEMVLLGEVAARGICTEGCDLYSSVFPCPPCAAPWSLSGIKRLYYAEGYSLVAAAETLQARGIEIVRVEMVA